MATLGGQSEFRGYGEMQTVADQFANILAAAGVNWIYGPVSALVWTRAYWPAYQG